MRRRRQKTEVAAWKDSGCPVPPPHAVKQDVLRSHARQFGLRILVETGTYLGDMVEALKAEFERVYSIELDGALHEKARDRFRRDRNVKLLKGDSADVLPGILAELDQPALFWLDGHYSGGITGRGESDTPVLSELDSILRSPEKGHVIVIDDARCFGTDPGYPDLDALTSMVARLRPDLHLKVAGDSIRITPREG